MRSALVFGSCLVWGLVACAPARAGHLDPYEEDEGYSSYEDHDAEPYDDSDSDSDSDSADAEWWLDEDEGWDDDDESAFYRPLLPHGTWVTISSYGRVFCPRVSHGWAPYRHGYWAWTRWGWAWVSDEPFGWATYHYGRWTQHPRFGWVWRPGRVWAPAWVQWRHGAGYVGWAPLGPREQRHRRHPHAGAQRFDEHAWTFAQERSLGGRNLAFAADVRERRRLLATTRHVDRHELRDGRRIALGPDPQRIEHARGRSLVEEDVERRIRPQTAPRNDLGTPEHPRPSPRHARRAERDAEAGHGGAIARPQPPRPDAPADAGRDRAARRGDAERLLRRQEREAERDREAAQHRDAAARSEGARTAAPAERAERWSGARSEHGAEARGQERAARRAEARARQDAERSPRRAEERTSRRDERAERRDAAESERVQARAQRRAERSPQPRRSERGRADRAEAAPDAGAELER